MFGREVVVERVRRAASERRDLGRIIGGSLRMVLRVKRVIRAGYGE